MFGPFEMVGQKWLPTGNHLVGPFFVGGGVNHLDHHVATLRAMEEARAEEEARQVKHYKLVEPCDTRWLVMNSQCHHSESV